VLSEDLRSLNPAYETGTVNSYLITGERRAVLFDSGLGIGDIAAAVRRLTPLPVTVVNSHSHWDHVGGNPLFGDVRVHPAGVPGLREEVALPDIGRALAGLELRPTPVPHRVGPSSPTGTVAEGDSLDLGGRRLRVLYTPGHSPDSVCLLDEAGGLLFTGDAAYEGTLWLFGGESADSAADPLVALASIRRLAAGPATLILPAHERTPLEPGFLSTLAQALTRALALAAEDATAGEPWSFQSPRPIARKISVNGLSFLLPPG
jgi:glyoxylase-like metal-dependent hydrolase (beta-lactamase superfamily II)